jgi:hypothetical protein
MTWSWATPLFLLPPLLLLPLLPVRSSFTA